MLPCFLLEGKGAKTGLLEVQIKLIKLTISLCEGSRTSFYIFVTVFS